MAAAKMVLRYLCSTSGMGLVLGGRSPVVLTGHAYASWADDQATQRSSQGYTFSLGSGSVSWRATRSSSVLGSSCEAEIYAGAMVAQELRWLTYLLTDLGELPRSPPVLYVDNKAMLALCREQRLEHRTKHIALCFFLARELQQRGQLRLAYVASEANTADVFTKALAPCDHQRFCTQLDAGHQAWHFILLTYQAKDDLYIGQMEEQMTHIRMGEQESASDYCNRARRILAEMRMVSAEYSTVSYITHVIKGPPRSYNIMKRLMMVPGMRESLDKDSITSYILQDESMQEAEQPMELLP
ncbi:unnamed protein product [Closterium sp. NIES-54]